MNNIIYKVNSSTKDEIRTHLNVCSDKFNPPLSSYVDIKQYSTKIFENATRFEAYCEEKLIGLIAVYLSKEQKYGFITNVSVEYTFQGLGISQKLLDKCIDYNLENGCKKLILEVYSINNKAINFYLKNNFKTTKSENILVMELELNRNYNQEFKDNERKYAYNFDFDVMHHYMIESFKHHFVEGNCLELGSFKGDFTKRLVPYFNDITCVEASDEAIKTAKQNLPSNITYFNSLFENVELPKKYDNIILTHVLEHIDDPVALLTKIKIEWLSENGKLFLVCPNANAPSRQIAVKMGLIGHNSAITPAEADHGHRITYTLDTLERDIKASGLNAIYRSGIFFKALANFQWDRLLQTDIISKEYLNGCYELGQQYPDLCSSLMFICKK
jgi:2-polyprenyl-3-methyl-5-hydroxy-6-metoxy-1,4-benzoquinol methylase